jgi:uncharacterized membrane protein
MMFRRKSPAETFLSASDRHVIADAIARAELTTSGEIRVKIITRCDSDVHGNIRDQAVREFQKEGLSQTRDKTGVLILIVVEEKRLYILADEGINSKVNQKYWDDHAIGLQFHFKIGAFARGICGVIVSIGMDLAKHFPRKEDDVDELPNEVIVGE